LLQIKERLKAVVYYFPNVNALSITLHFAKATFHSHPEAAV
jgi:hypothetical protein